MTLKIINKLIQTVSKNYGGTLTTFVYQDLSSTETIATIKSNLKEVSGIYAIIHNESGKIYVGSSINLAKRCLDHIKNFNSNVYLQNAINKHGLNQFSIYVLDLLIIDEHLDDKSLNEKLISLEQKYIDLFEDKYNINPLAGKTRLGAKHSEESKLLMSKLRKENPYFLNKKHSPEVIEQMRNRMSGSNNPMFGKPVTEENKKLISKLFSKPIYLYDANTLTLIAQFERQKDLIEVLKVSTKTLVKYKDTGEVFRDKYILSTFLINKED